MSNIKAAKRYYLIEQFGCVGTPCETIRVKRIDNARFHAERLSYDLHEANGTRDRAQAHTDRKACATMPREFSGELIAGTYGRIVVTFIDAKPIEEMPVIFRAERSGEFKGQVTAVFPTEPGTNEFDMSCYAHIGQHSSCSLDWYRGTRPATREESLGLMRELRSIYETGDDPVKLIRRRRIIPTDFHTRKKAMAR